MSKNTPTPPGNTPPDRTPEDMHKEANAWINAFKTARVDPPPPSAGQEIGEDGLTDDMRDSLDRGEEVYLGKADGSEYKGAGEGDDEDDEEDQPSGD